MSKYIKVIFYIFDFRPGLMHDLHELLQYTQTKKRDKPRGIGEILQIFHKKKHFCCGNVFFRNMIFGAYICITIAKIIKNNEAFFEVWQCILLRQLHFNLLAAAINQK